jgi:hypothetical protein
MFTALSQLHHGTIQKPTDAFDDVAVGHAHAHDGNSGFGWWPG